MTQDDAPAKPDPQAPPIPREEVAQAVNVLRQLVNPFTSVGKCQRCDWSFNHGEITHDRQCTRHAADVVLAELADLRQQVETLTQAREATPTCETCRYAGAVKPDGRFCNFLEVEGLGCTAVPLTVSGKAFTCAAHECRPASTEGQ